MQKVLEMAFFCHWAFPHAGMCMFFQERWHFALLSKLRHYFLFLLVFFFLSPTVFFLYPLKFICISPRYFNIDPSGQFKELYKLRSPQDMHIGFQDCVLQLQTLILCSMPYLLFRCLSKALMVSSLPPVPGMWRKRVEKDSTKKKSKSEINEEKSKFYLYFLILCLLNFTCRKCQ